MPKVPVGNLPLGEVLERYLQHTGRAQQQPTSPRPNDFHRVAKGLRKKSTRRRPRYNRRSDELRGLRQADIEITASVEELRQAYARGDLVAKHLGEKDGREFEEPAGGWRDEPYLLTRAFFFRGNYEGDVLYTDKDEFETWLRRVTQASDRPATAAAETRCRKWLIEQQNGPHAGPKGNYLERAKKDFVVSERAFNRAWKAAIAQTGSDWGKPGRRKS